MSIRKNALNTAVLIGGVLIILSILFYVFGVKPGSPLNYLSFVVLLAGMIWGTITLRDKYRNGGLSYGDAFLSGFLIATFSGIISAVFSFVFYKWIATEQIGVMLKNAEEQMLEKYPQLTDEQIEAFMQMQEKFMTPLGISVMALVSTVLVSLLLALIIAIFLKKQVVADPFAKIEE